MKKLITIALALVMVLALAVPAFAVYGWEAQPATTTTLSDGLTLTLAQYEYVPATTGFDWMNNYYNNWSPTTGVVAGTNVRLVATVDAIAKSGINATILKDITSLKLAISSTNLFFTGASAMRYVKNSTTGIYEVDTTFGDTGRLKDLAGKINAAGKFSWTMGDVLASKNAVKVQVMLTAQVVATADATVTASLSCGKTSFTDDGYFYFTKGGQNYTVKHDGSYYYVWNDTTPLRVVRFTVDSANKVTDIHVSLQDLLNTYVTSVTALTNKEQAALASAVYAEYVDVATLYDLDPYEIAYWLWEEYVTQLNPALVSGKVYWTDGSHAYSKLTSEGAAAFAKFLSDADIDVSYPTDSALRGLGISYMLGTLQTDASYLTRRAAVYSAYNAYVAASFAVADAGLDDYGDFPPIDIYAAYTADVATLERAVVNQLMAEKAYVYFTTTGNYTYSAVAPKSDIVKVSNIFTLNGADPSNILGQIGKLSSSSTVIAPYYRASYNVNTGVLTFGNAGETLDGGYQKIYGADGSEIVTAGTMGAAIQDAGAFFATCDANTVIPSVVVAGNTNLEVYSKIDSHRIGDSFVVKNEYFQSGNNYNYLKATFTEITNVLSFNWDGTTSYMYEDAFLANFAAQLSLSQSVTYTAYAAQLIVADPNAQPPQTGDASSILGFVMIALAVVAAGAVVVKKVRA